LNRIINIIMLLTPVLLICLRPWRKMTMYYQDFKCVAEEKQINDINYFMKYAKIKTTVSTFFTKNKCITTK